MNNKFEITGGKKLQGEVPVSGEKNSALKLLPAALLCGGRTVISNFPFIEDTKRMIEIMEEFGIVFEKNAEKKELVVDPSKIQIRELRGDLIRKLRASILLTAPLLARFGKINLPHPGGCIIGQRPIDMFIEGYKKLGVNVTDLGEDGIELESEKGKLQGGKYFFPKVTVTGTETMILSAVLAEGETILENCAMEPGVVQLAKFLNKCGAEISGAGTPTIHIQGVEGLKGSEVTVIPDRIEAGTFIMMGLACQSKIKITNCNPCHLDSLITILKKAGAKLEVGEDYIATPGEINLKATSVITHEYPGFATDLQPPYTLLMTQAEGTCLIHETIFESRLFFIDLLKTMNANIIMCDPHRVVVAGPSQLYGRHLTSPDLRAGITLVIAGMIAQGKTVIDNIYQIDRGYGEIEKRLSAIGAEIRRVN